MGMLLHWSFQASFAEPATLTEETVRRGLRPFLALLDYRTELHFAVSGSGAFLERLDHKTGELVAKYLDAGRIEILLAPYAPPAGRWLGIDSLEEQLGHCESIWKERGVTRFGGVYLPRPVAKESATRLTRGPVFVTEPPLHPVFSGAGGAERLPLGDAAGRAVTIAMSAASLPPERLSAVEQRNALLDLLKDLRGEAAGTTMVPTAFAAAHPASVGSPQIADAVPSQSGDADRLAARVEQLAAELAPLPEHVKTMAKEVQNRERLKTAQRALLAARAQELWTPPEKRKAIVEAILRAQVEADTLNNPDTDPMIGWITHELKDVDGDGTAEIIADTQLMRLYFSPANGGALSELDYKPRKFDLTGAFDAAGAVASFVDGLVTLNGSVTAARLAELSGALTPASGGAAEALVTRQTKDFFGLRLVRTFGERRWVKHYAIKAGLGAHLSNSTTGLSYEFWIEGSAPPPGMSAVSRLAFMLPSATGHGVSLRPLSAVGGEGPKALPLEHPLALETKDVDGGLYGGRLIDGIDNFVMDIRSAKPLDALGCFPLESAAGFGGFVMLFFIEARRVYQDDKANTVFLSIR